MRQVHCKNLTMMMLWKVFTTDVKLVLEKEKAVGGDESPTAIQDMETYECGTFPGPPLLFTYTRISLVETRARNTLNYLVLDPEGYFFIAPNFFEGMNPNAKNLFQGERKGKLPREVRRFYIGHCLPRLNQYQQLNHLD